VCKASKTTLAAFHSAAAYKSVMDFMRARYQEFFAWTGTQVGRRAAGAGLGAGGCRRRRLFAWNPLVLRGCSASPAAWARALHLPTPTRPAAPAAPTAAGPCACWVQLQASCAGPQEPGLGSHPRPLPAQIVLGEGAGTTQKRQFSWADGSAWDYSDFWCGAEPNNYRSESEVRRARGALLFHIAALGPAASRCTSACAGAGDKAAAALRCTYSAPACPRCSTSHCRAPACPHRPPGPQMPPTPSSALQALLPPPSPLQRCAAAIRWSACLKSDQYDNTGFNDLPCDKKMDVLCYVADPACA
jgi:hypothetical protein